MLFSKDPGKFYNLIKRLLLLFCLQYRLVFRFDILYSELACAQALHLGDIVKSTRARGTGEEMQLRGAGKRKGELASELPTKSKKSIQILSVFK